MSGPFECQSVRRLVTSAEKLSDDKAVSFEYHLLLLLKTSLPYLRWNKSTIYQRSAVYCKVSHECSVSNRKLFVADPDPFLESRGCEKKFRYTEPYPFPGYLHCIICRYLTGYGTVVPRTVFRYRTRKEPRKPKKNSAFRVKICVLFTLPTVLPVKKAG
jgi:hypothetical protein